MQHYVTYLCYLPNMLNILYNIMPDKKEDENVFMLGIFAKL